MAHTPWQQIEKDINTLQSTGIWPSSQVPEWAAEVAKRLHCSSAAAAVIECGLKEIIHQLKIAAGVPYVS